MYTPINWANPTNLEIIKEKREAGRIETPTLDETVNVEKGIFAKWMDSLIKTCAYKLKPTFEM